MKGALYVDGVVPSLMYEHVPRVDEFLVAHHANERLYAQMFIVVLLEDYRIVEAFPAGGAGVVELVVVHPVDVCLEASPSRGVVTAERTRVGVVGAVGLHVHREAVSLLRGVFADVAGVELLVHLGNVLLHFLLRLVLRRTGVARVLVLLFVVLEGVLVLWFFHVVQFGVFGEVASGFELHQTPPARPDFMFLFLYLFLNGFDLLQFLLLFVPRRSVLLIVHLDFDFLFDGQGFVGRLLFVFSV